MTKHVLSLSYGKDSLACLGAIEKLGWPLDRIIHAEEWATKTIPVQLPPMMEFKAKADEIIKRRWGIEVERICAKNPTSGERLTFQDVFYSTHKSGKHTGQIYGFPMTRGPWCQDRLKAKPLDAEKRRMQKAGTVVGYVGIAADETKRLERLDGVTKVSPLAAAGWDEAYCLRWCEENDLLSPIYATTARSGCWFCHNQSLGQFRNLRKDYPDLWALLLKWDKDSPVTFLSNGRTVHDLERRFGCEEKGLVPCDNRFKWKMLDDLEGQITFDI